MSKKAKVDPKSITKFSEGKTELPKRGRRNASGSRSGKVETFKPDPRVVAEVKRIKNQNPNVKVKWNPDGTAEITNG